MNANLLNHTFFTKTFGDFLPGEITYTSDSATTEAIELFRVHLRSIYLKENPHPLHMIIPSVALHHNKKRKAKTMRDNLKEVLDSQFQSMEEKRRRRSPRLTVTKIHYSDSDSNSNSNSDQSNYFKALLQIAEKAYLHSSTNSRVMSVEDSASNL